MKMKEKKMLPVGGRLLMTIMALTFTAYACGSPEESNTQSESLPSVDVEQAVLKSVPASYRFSGTVISDKTVQLSTKISGRVEQLDVEEGDYVTEGSVLIRIKDDNLQAQRSQVEASLVEARAALKNTETNFNRIKALFEKESATQKELDDISTQYEIAQANVQALEAKRLEIQDLLDYTVLEAPFNGYVVDKRISEGDLAGPGQPLLSFEQEETMKVEVTVPETQISLFTIGDTVRVDIKAANRQKVTGTIANVNPSGNRASRQFRVEITLPGLEKGHGLKSGMFAEVGLQTVTDEMITIPESAVIERGQLTGIYTLTNNSEVVLRWVRLGDTIDGSVEVLSGLAPGESYLATFDGSIREGQKVQAQ